MTAKNLSTVATDLITTYGNTARNVINAYRVGGERVVGFLEQRWETALEQSRPQLTEEVADNALAAQRVFGSYYAKGIALATNSADTVVSQFVKIAGAGVQSVAANASLFEEKTGVTALNTLAGAAVPAVQAVTKLAEQIEAKSAELATKIAGEEAAAAKRTSAFRKARTAHAA